MLSPHFLVAPDEVVVAAHGFMREVVTQAVEKRNVREGSDEWTAMLVTRLAAHRDLLNATRAYLGFLARPSWLGSCRTGRARGRRLPSGL